MDILNKSIKEKKQQQPKSLNKIIQSAAFEMFRDWTKIASNAYPDMDFTIIDETKLVIDTQKTIAQAVESLFSPEYDEDRKIIGKNSVRFPDKDYFSREEIKSFIEIFKP